MKSIFISSIKKPKVFVKVFDDVNQGIGEDETTGIRIIILKLIQ